MGRSLSQFERLLYGANYLRLSIVVGDGMGNDREIDDETAALLTYLATPDGMAGILIACPFWLVTWSVACVLWKAILSD